MSKNSSAKYYQDNTKKTTKKAFERYQSLYKTKKKRKSDNIAMKDIKISQKMEHKSWLSKEKIIIKLEEMPYYNYKKLISFKKISFFLGLS